MRYITGDDVSQEQVQHIGSLFNIELWPSAQTPFIQEGLKRASFPSALGVLTDQITEEKLNTLFALPISTIIDVHSQEESIQDFLTHQTKNKLDYYIGFLLTCPIIYHCDVAKIFMDALQTRLHFSTARFDAIHLALHESLVNSLIHGNLQLSSGLRQSAHDFVAYTKILNDRLQDPAYAQKSVSIWATWNKKKLEIKIRDEGIGYAVSDTLKKEPELKAKSGRGLRLIAGTADSCTIDDFGREITLSFLLNENDYQVDEPILDETSHEHRELTDLSECRVLIIEDNPSNQALLAALLPNIGIVHIDIASDGIEGLNKVLTFKPDLIILDITMPRMDGHEVLYHLKSVDETKDIPVLIETASDTREARDKTFKSGAADFITKPINPLEFFSRVRVHLENRLLIKHLENQLQKIEAELKAAQHMQIAMLPTQEDLEHVKEEYALEIAHYFSPSSQLGGDFWQIIPLSENRVGIYLCDFSGHGVAAAFNTFRLHAIISQLDKTFEKPSDFMKQLNKQLYSLLPRGQFATFFFGIWDSKTQTITYAGAGSPSPFLNNGKETIRLETRGIPLGIISNPEYEDKTVPFHPHDQMLMYSDALTESPNIQGERLGEEGFLNLIRPFAHIPDTKETLDHILKAFFNFAPPPPPDDVTAVLIKAHTPSVRENPDKPKAKQKKGNPK